MKRRLNASVTVAFPDSRAKKRGAAASAGDASVSSRGTPKRRGYFLTIGQAFTPASEAVNLAYKSSTFFRASTVETSKAPP